MMTMMTLDETMVFNNMTNAIKNQEQSKSVSDIIDDLNKLILTLGGCNHDIIDQPKHETKTELNKATTVTPVQIKTESKTKAEPTATPVHIKTGTKAKAEPVQKQTKAE